MELDKNRILVSDNINTKEEKETPSVCEDTIEFDNYSRQTRKGKYLLKNISIRIPKNRLVALMGLSGDGKSTFFNAIAGRCEKETVTYGEVNVLSKNGSLEPRDSVSWFKQVGYSMQENVQYGSMPTYRVLKSVATMENVPYSKIASLMKSFRVEKTKNTPFNRLSGGEQRRIFTIIGLLKTKEINLWDEPISGLDAHIARIAILSIQKEKSTNIVSIHQPSEAILSLFEDIIFMHASTIVYSGPLKDLQLCFEEKGIVFPRGETCADYLIKVSANYSENETDQKNIEILNSMAESICSLPCGKRAEGNVFFVPSFTARFRNVQEILLRSFYYNKFFKGSSMLVEILFYVMLVTFMFFLVKSNIYGEIIRAVFTPKEILNLFANNASKVLCRTYITISEYDVTYFRKHPNEPLSLFYNLFNLDYLFFRRPMISRFGSNLEMDIEYSKLVSVVKEKAKVFSGNPELNSMLEKSVSGMCGIENIINVISVIGYTLCSIFTFIMLLGICTSANITNLCYYRICKRNIVEGRISIAECIISQLVELVFRKGVLIFAASCAVSILAKRSFESFFEITNSIGFISIFASSLYVAAICMLWIVAILLSPFSQKIQSLIYVALEVSLKLFKGILYLNSAISFSLPENEDFIFEKYLGKQILNYSSEVLNSEIIIAMLNTRWKIPKFLGEIIVKVAVFFHNYVFFSLDTIKELVLKISIYTGCLKDPFSKFKSSEELLAYIKEASAKDCAEHAKNGTATVLSLISKIDEKYKRTDGWDLIKNIIVKNQFELYKRIVGPNEIYASTPISNIGLLSILKTFLKPLLLPLLLSALSIVYSYFYMQPKIRNY
ncbi:hypothetical protein NEMIN01_2331 [Nematocida minor]|uniref:uncharacterized protein n=1 Tax=Nematocida minor TaxID=1912983 RepID=UPI00221F751F|nr:uncharacterized protein NEMIN01_2331 [Nematocida minor]KAI5192984.1 hypothetical protein NEMIN01_2331 [Nematocida minor]